MIVEYVRYRIGEGRRVGFEHAYVAATAVLTRSPHRVDYDPPAAWMSRVAIAASRATSRCGYPHMLSQHVGKAIREAQRRRWVAARRRGQGSCSRSPM
ncbi:MAG: hypothetical protein M3423_06245 [Actinomycetota bacterium]|nr:hypothetical protein [Actinomycetota bacterium]